MGFLVEMSLWALVMAFYTLFMVFGPEKIFKLISGRFGENPEFLCFQLFFRPQKVFLLPIFLLLTWRPWALGHFIRAKGWSKKYFFPACLLLTFCRICIEKFYFFFVWKAPIGIQKWASVERRTKTHWTKQLSKNTWILIISWKTGVLGVNKAKNLKILKKNFFFENFFRFFTSQTHFFH